MVVPETEESLAKESSLSVLQVMANNSDSESTSSELRDNSHPSTTMAGDNNNADNGTPTTVGNLTLASAHSIDTEISFQSPHDKVRAIQLQRQASRIRRRSNPEKKRWKMFLRYSKCIGLTSFISFSIFFFSYFIYFGSIRHDNRVMDDEDSSESSLFTVQMVLPGIPVALARNGRTAAVRDDYDKIQMYEKDDEATTTWRWNTMGDTIQSVDGTVTLSANGTLVGYVDALTLLPQILEYAFGSWIQLPAPTVQADAMSMDDDATVLALGYFGKTGNVSDVLLGDDDNSIVAYHKEESGGGDGWVPFANEIQLSDIQLFELSPTGSEMVVVHKENGQENATVRVYQMEEDSDSGDFLWNLVVDDIVLDTEDYVLALGQQSFALGLPEKVRVYAYSGRMIGTEITVPEDLAGMFVASVAMNLEGSALAVGFLDEFDDSGVVEFFGFPRYYDTGDAWEEGTQTLTAMWGSDGNSIRDDYGTEALFFGSELLVDGDFHQLLVQSGSEGDENAHFYNFTLA